MIEHIALEAILALLSDPGAFNCLRSLVHKLRSATFGGTLLCCAEDALIIEGVLLGTAPPSALRTLSFAPAAVSARSLSILDKPLSQQPKLALSSSGGFVSTFASGSASSVPPPSPRLSRSLSRFKVIKNPVFRRDEGGQHDEIAEIPALCLAQQPAQNSESPHRA